MQEICSISVGHDYKVESNEKWNKKTTERRYVVGNQVYKNMADSKRLSAGILAKMVYLHLIMPVSL